MDEPVCFVPTGKGAARGDATPSADGRFMLVSTGEYGDEEPGYRKLKPGWLDAAVERQYAAIKNSLHTVVSERGTKDALRAALFPPSEPTAEQVIGECVVALEALRGTALDAKEIGPDLKAQIVRATEACRAFAKARRAREEKR